MALDKERLTPIKAIRAFCEQCMGGHIKEVTLCTAPKCPLFPYRFGKNPYLPGGKPASPEFMAKIRQKLHNKP